MFTKKHYEAIAQIFNRHMKVYSKAQPMTEEDQNFIILLNIIISDIANLFEQDNPRFDNNKFWRACHP